MKCETLNHECDSSICGFERNRTTMVAFQALVCSLFLFGTEEYFFTYSFVTSSDSSRKISWRKMVNNNNIEMDSTAKVQRQTWNPLRLAVLRLGLTEPMMTSSFNYGNYKDGVFNCAYCWNPLFDGSAKYDSGSGWPSFWRTRNDDAISYRMEADGRLECKCKRCNSHLGHVFLDGPRPNTVDSKLLEASPESDPRGRSGTYLPRFCINGAAMTYRKNSSP